MITTAQWDTDNFGIKVGNLTFQDCITVDTIKEARAEAQLKGYDLLYIKNVDIPVELLDERLFLADEKVVYTQHISEIQIVDDETISVFHQSLSEDLLALAYESGKYSRYRLDGKLPLCVYPTLYSQWISNSLSGELADDVLTIQKDGYCVGLLTYKKSDEKYDIGLVAVSPDFSGKGLGTKLMQSFLSQVELGAEVEVATQKHNVAACRYYERNGFVIKNITKIYHLWVK